jgi:acetyltransferase (GNAT) family protein
MQIWSKQLYYASLVNQNLITWLSFFNIEQISDLKNAYYRLNSGVPDALFNSIMLAKISDPTSITSITDFFKNKNLPYSWWMDEKDITQPLYNHFESEKYTFFGDVPGMFFDIAQYQIPNTKQTAEIRKITDRETFKEWVHVVGQVFSLSPEAEQLYIDKLSPFLGQDDIFLAFGAYKDNKIVATSSIVTSNGIGGFYNMATLSDYRQQGYCHAMHHARLTHLKQNGIKTAVIQTSPMATNIALNIGFKPVINYKIYLYLN